MTDEQIEAINDVAEAMHANACDKGFHARMEGMDLVDRTGTYTANLHGEVSELWEAARDGKLFDQCNKPIPLTCAEEECADIAIRNMDTAVKLGVNLGRAIAIKAAYNRERPFMHNKLA